MKAWKNGNDYRGVFFFLDLIVKREALKYGLLTLPTRKGKWILKYKKKVMHVLLLFKMVLSYNS